MSRYFFFNRPRRNAGYTKRTDGTALSLRASYAEDEGKFTAGKFRTIYGVNKKAFDALVMIGVIVTNEWHHTGKSFKKNDFYEWEDDDFLQIYDDNKQAVIELANQLENAQWVYEEKKFICYVEPYDTFKAYSIKEETDLLLTEAEQEHRRKCHAEVSHSGIESSYERYLLHKQIDERFDKMAAERINDDTIQQSYEKKYGENIRINAERTKFNEELKARNLSTKGKENILIQLASLFFDDADMYELAYNASVKAKVAEREAQWKKEAEERRKVEEEKQKVLKAKRDEAKQKALVYLDKCIKSGKAIVFSRISKDSLTELHHVECEEMNGKYGWFEANSKYNMPIYYSGHRFTDKRTMNHYMKLQDNY